CVAAEFVLIEGQALAYVPIDFSSADEYLSRLSHARRKSLRRKLRSRELLTVEALHTGDAQFSDSQFLDRLYRMYMNVYMESEIHFDLLTAEFFRAVLQDRSVNGVIFIYRSGSDVIGY